MLAGANPSVVGTLHAQNMFYVATSGNCGGVANGVYAIDMTPTPPPPDAPPARGPVPPNMTPANPAVRSWKTNGGSVVGTAGVALAPDGVAFVATGDGDQSATALSNSVVALDGKTLAQKDYFSPGKTPFVTSPVVFVMGSRTLVAAANRDGRLYVLDAASLGGADHATPLAKSAVYSSGQRLVAGTVSTFEAGGTRWLLVATTGSIPADAGFSATNGAVTNGAILAFRVVDQGGTLSLQPAWASRDLRTPASPAVMNGVVFALATGENLAAPAGNRAQGASNAVLYALDGASGRELWNSGTSISTFVPGVAPAANDSQIYVAGNDGTLYVFGTVVDR